LFLFSHIQETQLSLRDRTSIARQLRAHTIPSTESRLPKWLSKVTQGHRKRHW